MMKWRGHCTKLTWASLELSRKLYWAISSNPSMQTSLCILTFIPKLPHNLLAWMISRFSNWNSSRNYSKLRIFKKNPVSTMFQMQKMIFLLERRLTITWSKSWHQPTTFLTLKSRPISRRFLIPSTFTIYPFRTWCGSLQTCPKRLYTLSKPKWERTRFSTEITHLNWTPIFRIGCMKVFTKWTNPNNQIRCSLLSLIMPSNMEITRSSMWCFMKRSPFRPSKKECDMSCNSSMRIRRKAKCQTLPKHKPANWWNISFSRHLNLQTLGGYLWIKRRNSITLLRKSYRLTNLSILGALINF